jgi:hypothetical protein
MAISCIHVGPRHKKNTTQTNIAVETGEVQGTDTFRVLLIWISLSKEQNSR